METVWAAAPLVAAAGTWLARRYALGRRLLDEPGERRSHRVATPRGGGVGPVLAIAMLLAVLGVDGRLPGLDWRWSLAGLLAVAGVGAWDDHRPLGVGIRLVVHVAAGSALAVGAGLADDPVAALLAAAAVTVAINVWNFMDGIDGIAATQAVVVALAVACIVAPAGAVLPLGVALAVAAFVPFNFPAARIFLGDVGSGALGYAVVLLALTPAPTAPPTQLPLLVLFPAAAFLVDATLTLASRMHAGERWWTPHTRHLYQVAARRVGHPRVTLAYGAWSLGGAGLGCALANAGSPFIVASLVLWYTTAAGLWVRLQDRWALKEHGGMTETDR